MWSISEPSCKGQCGTPLDECRQDQRPCWAAHGGKLAPSPAGLGVQKCALEAVGCARLLAMWPTGRAAQLWKDAPPLPTLPFVERTGSIPLWLLEGLGNVIHLLSAGTAGLPSSTSWGWKVQWSVAACAKSWRQKRLHPGAQNSSGYASALPNVTANEAGVFRHERPPMHVVCGKGG